MTLNRAAFFAAAATILGSESEELLELTWNKLAAGYSVADSELCQKDFGSKVLIFFSFLKILTAKPKDLEEVAISQGLNFYSIQSALEGEELNIDPCSVTAPLFEALFIYGLHKC